MATRSGAEPRSRARARGEGKADPGEKMRRLVTADDLLNGQDLQNPDRTHAIQSPEGSIIVPRPRPGYRFVRWETRAALNEAWAPVPPTGQVQRYVRAHYEQEDLRG